MRLFPLRSFMLFVLLLGIASLIASAEQVLTSPADEIRIRQVTLAKDQMAAALKKVEEGTFERFTPAEFDKLVKGQHLRQNEPDRPAAGIVEARYRAKYSLDANGESALIGTAEWMVRHNGANPVDLSLEGFQVPLRQAKWSDGQDAILYKAAKEAHPRLHISAGEKRSLNLEWTSRGFTEPGEVQFELKLPTVPIASFELELPIGLVPVFPQDDVLLTGPYPAGPNLALWRASFAGTSRLELILRSATDEPGLLFSSVSAVESVLSGESTARYEFQVESPKTGFTEIAFEHDDGLLPTSVHVNNLASWSTSPNDRGGGIVNVRLREPTRSAAVIVNATFSTPVAGTRWTSRGMWLRGGVQRSERLRMIVGSDFGFREWNPGDYSLLHGELAADRSYSLAAEPVLNGKSQSRPRRPSFVLISRKGNGWIAAQQGEWTIGRHGDSWVVRTKITGDSRPRVFRAPIPSGWVVEHVESGMQDATWSMSNRSRVLSVEVGSTGIAEEITVRLRADRRIGERPVPMPDLYPEGAAGRTGSLTIRAEPGLELRTTDSPSEAPIRAEATDNERVWILPPHELSASVFVRPRLIRYHAELTTEVSGAKAERRLHTNITLIPADSAVDAVTFWTPAVVSEPWGWYDDRGRWIGNAVRFLEREAQIRLLQLSASTPLTGLTLSAALGQSGFWWRLRLPRPVDQRVQVQSTFKQSPTQILPVPWIFGFSFNGSVRIPDDVEPDELDRRWTLAWVSPGSGREYRYGNAGQRFAAKTAHVKPQAERPRLVTALQNDGHVRAKFQLRIRRWIDGVLVLQLPPAADDPIASVAGHRIPVRRDGIDGLTLSLQVPVTENWVEVGVDYSLPIPSAGITRRLPFSPPTGPFDPLELECNWHIAPAWRVLDQDRFSVVPGARALVAGLPLPDVKQVAGDFGWRSQAHATGMGGGQTIADKLEQAFPGKPILIDVHSAVSAGLSAASTLPIEDFKVLGLVIVETPESLLVTRALDHARWRGEGGWLTLLPADVSAALAEAVASGHDTSGRFQSLATWRSAVETDTSFLDAPPGWIILRGLDNQTEGPLVYRHDRVEPWCWLIVVAIVGGVFVFVRRERLRFWLLFVIGSLLLVAYAAFPFDLSELLGVVLFGACMAIAANSFVSPTRSPDVSTLLANGKLSAAIAGVLIVVAIARAAPGTPREVFQILDDRGEVTAILAPRELCEQLRGRSASARPNVVVTSATYSGSPDGGSVRFRARYRLYSFEERSYTTIPLTGVRYRSVTLDGAEARDIDTTAAGLRVSVVGKGMHTLELDFAVSTTTIGGDEELKLAVPEVLLSSLSFDLPGRNRVLRSGAWRGLVKASKGSKGTSLEADLGPVSTIGLRWSTSTSRKVLTRTTEASIWRLTPSTATLESMIEYRLSDGSSDQFQIAIPPATEVLKLTVRGDSNVSVVPGVRIKDWNVANSNGKSARRLRVQLLQPVTRVAFQMELVHTDPAVGKGRWAFPKAIGADESETYLAIDLQSLKPSGKIDSNGMSDVSVEAFHDRVWLPLSGTRYSGTITKAFRLTGSKAAQLGLDAQSPASISSVVEQASWLVERDRWSGSIETRWQGNNFSMVEWSVPPSVKVREVTGRNLWAWTQSGGLVRVWFDRPVAEAVLLWRATQPLGATRTTLVKMPTITHDAEATDLIRRMRASNGWVLLRRDMSPMGEKLVSRMPGEIAWRTERDSDFAFELHPPANAVMELLTQVSARDGRPSSIHRLNLSTIPSDRPHLLTIDTIASRGDDVQLSLQSPLIATEVSSPADRRQWLVYVPKGPSVDDSIQVSVKSGSEQQGGWRLPLVIARFGPISEPATIETISVTSEQVKLTDTANLRSVGSNVWRALDSDRHARVTVRKGPQLGDEWHGSANLMTTRRGRLWHYWSRFEFNTGRPGRVEIALPAGARWRSIEVAGIELALPGPAPSSTAVLPDMPSELTLHWVSDFPVWENAKIKIDNERLGIRQTNWHIYVPADLRIAGANYGSGKGREGLSFGHERLAAPCDGIPFVFHIGQDESLDLQLLPKRDQLDLTVFTALCIWLMLGLVRIRWPQSSRPEQAGLAISPAVVVIGPSTAILLLLPVGVAIWRIGWLLHRIKRNR